MLCCSYYLPQWPVSPKLHLLLHSQVKGEHLFWPHIDGQGQGGVFPGPKCVLQAQEQHRSAQGIQAQDVQVFGQTGIGDFVIFTLLSSLYAVQQSFE